jgi:uncharacterized repeat protein (TIGR03847 family)
MVIELDPVDRITADAVGEPGERSFFLQARKGTELVTLLVEKQQVQLLAASVVEILARVGKETGEGPDEDQMGLEEPIEPAWRVGRLSIGYEEERDLLLLEVAELLPEEEGQYEALIEAEDPTGLEAIGPELVVGFEAEEEAEEEAEAEEIPEEPTEEDLRAIEALEAVGEPGEGNQVRMWATREQMLSLARHAAAVSARGRPRCPLCGNPMEPEGHNCPALNGHGKIGES